MKHKYPQRGYIYWYVLPENEVFKNTSIQSPNRPWLVVSNDIGNKYSPTVIACPCTTSKQKKQLPTHIEVIARGTKDIILTEQIQTLPIKHLVLSPVAQLNDEEITRVNKALQISLGIIPQDEWYNDE